MTLGSALQIGRSALTTHQAAIEVAGNNLANMATQGYHRQRILLEPLRNQQLQAGIFVGRGVQMQSITRQVDAALEGRVRANLADQSFSLARRDILSQIEALQNEFSDSDLSSHLNAFFNAWSELANNPQNHALRTVVLRQGSTLSGFVQTLRAGLGNMLAQVDDSIGDATVAVNNLLDEIAAINEQIVKSNVGAGGSADLLDIRDSLLGQLAEFLDISVIEQPSGLVDVFVGSIPMILNGINLGIDVRDQTVDGERVIDLVLKDNGSVLLPTSGRLGALIEAREQDVNFALNELDGFINTFIYEINKTHSQGQGLVGFETVTGSNRVADQGVALNDSQSGLKFTPVHGSLRLHVLQRSIGQRQSTTLAVDLDGIDPANDTNLSALAAAIDAVDNVGASVTADGRLVISTTTSDFEFSFSDDTSGVLAALGINSYFAGSNAEDITVNTEVSENPSFLAAALGHLPGDNSNTLALAALRDQGVDSLNGLTINEAWASHVENFAVRLDQTNQQFEAETLVGGNLSAQQQSVSGVNADEEVINLMAFQRAYQSSARFLQVVDELLETLMSLA